MNWLGGTGTPLQLERRSVFKRAIKALIDRGADVSARDEQGRPVLQYAAEGRLEKVALELLETHGAAWEGGELDDSMLVVVVTMQLPRLAAAILQRLRAKKMGAEAYTAELQRAAISATVRQGSVPCLEVLVRGGLDLKAWISGVEMGMWQMPPTPLLHRVSAVRDSEAAEYLICQGCDPCELDHKGRFAHEIKGTYGGDGLRRWLVSHYPLTPEHEAAAARRRPQRWRPGVWRGSVELNWFSLLNRCGAAREQRKQTSKATLLVLRLSFSILLCCF